MARCTNKEETTDLVIPPNPEDNRDEYITNYFENIYKADPTVVVNDNSIDEFLGPTANEGTVVGAKLTDNEKTSLERDLSLRELDQALKSSKNKSSPGIDGIGYDFIRKFWPYLRKPMLDYANCCYENGRLTDSFRLAKIRLIPKKGDLHSLKNWRPISLLSCFYRVLSRAISSRLRKYMDKLTPIGQKGFSSSRQCQEPLINLTDIISKCNRVGRRACILSLDIGKAFDSISHTYLTQVLKFYNFGPRFIKWVILISTNRLACIIKGNGELGRNFPLHRGNAQGDIISPFLFNLCFQIFIYKIEFDVRVHGILDEPTAPDPDVARQPPLVEAPQAAQRLEPATVPAAPAAPGRAPAGPEEPPVRRPANFWAPPIAPAPDPGPGPVRLAQAPLDDRPEQHRLQVQQVYPYSKNVFAYADDGTLVLELNHENLHRVTEILDEFSSISGLKCNIDKTHLMQIGPAEEISEEIINVGFNITDEITVLGMVIRNNIPETLAINMNQIKDKIRKQVDFWHRFNLSLPGRIIVAKSLLYSQLNYLGCFLPTNKNFCTEIDDMICNFVRGNLNISKKRFYQTPADGGLGLFEINEFLLVQRCSWIRRAHNKIDDYWKHSILTKSDGNVLKTTGNDFLISDYPVLHNIASNYAEWLRYFWKYNENYKLAPILNNPIFSLQQNGAVPVTWNFFVDYMPQYRINILALTTASIHNGTRFYSTDEFNDLTGIPITQRKLTALRGVYDTAVIRYNKNDPDKKKLYFSRRIPEFHQERV